MARPSRIRNLFAFLILTSASLLVFLTAFVGFTYFFVTSDYIRVHMERHAAAANPQPQVPLVASTQ
jgi:hypothetical protein